MRNKEFFPPILQRFINYEKTIRGLSKQTVENYANDLMLFFKYIVMLQHEFKKLENVSFERVKDEVSDKVIIEVDRDTIYSFLYYLDEDRKASVATRKRRLSALSNFYKYIKYEENLITEIPTENIPHPKQPKREPKVLDLDDIDALFNAVIMHSSFKERDVCILTFFFHLGLRREELSSINLQEIKKKTLHIIGKGNKERILPLDEACIKALEAYLPMRITPKDSEDINALFTSREGHRMSPQTIYGRIKKFALLAGLSPEISPHSCRHTFATLMLTNSNDIISLQALMGHESINTTEKYVHLASSKHEDMIKNNPLNQERQYDFTEDL